MKYVLSILCCFVCLAVTAQKKKIWGVVLDSVTHAPVELASITNLDKRITTVSNEAGKFSIDVANNQILSIGSVNYYFDTLNVSDKILMMDTLVMYLKPISKNLQGVTVTQIVNRYRYDSLQRRNSFLQDVGGNKIPTLSKANSGAGIGISIDRFSRREKQKRKAFDMFDAMEKEQYINYRFSPQLVSQYTALKGDALIDFMQKQRPDYKWLRQHPQEEDMKYYINEQLKVYYKRSN
jgi:hypothetical protein